MPWLGESGLASPSARKWQNTFRSAFSKRISADRLEAALKELALKYRISAQEIARILIGSRAKSSGVDDPLLFSYVALLLRLKLVGQDDVLTALLYTSKFGTRYASEQPGSPSHGLPTCEERVFNILTQMHMTGALSCPVSQSHGIVRALARWMHAVTEYEMGKQLEGGALHSADAFAFGLYEAVASLALTVLSSSEFRKVTKQQWWKKRRNEIVTQMQSFDSHVLQWMQSQLAGRLSALATLPPFIETDEKGRPVFTDDQVLQSIQDLPVVNSRAGLYIYLNACLCGRPLTDDLSMLTYLQARYSGNNQTLVVDLLVASFDVLTNVLLRNESEQNQKVVRSFICNKMPLQLQVLSGFMGPAMTVETCVQMAFMTITMDALPPISAGSTEVREKLKNTRLEFLQACALHNLVSDNARASILQEPPLSLPKVTKYTKESLVAKHGSNVGSLEPLMDELDGMQGNAGAIAGCIVDIVSNLCLSKDTMSLKTLCNMVIRRIGVVDVLMQYTPPSNLLLPLCTQLNDWIHDQDQAEFTPAYEEFASILLFIFVVVHRYGLKRADLGLLNDDNFVAKLLQETPMSENPTDLSPEQHGQLSKWIEALYATDDQGETSGISDDVMRSCPPQAFYQLVPTLFEQSVLACKSGKLTMKTFKGGLELLVEPFLLPSLVGGLSWLIKHSWEDHGDAEVLLQVLEKLLRPPSTSSSAQETKALHQAILGIVAKPLYQSLQNLTVKQPKKKDVNSCMEILKPYLDIQRTMESSKTELEEWLSTPNGGTTQCLRIAIRNQVAWISNVGPTPPPKYTHRLFAVACADLGVDAVLKAIIVELKEQFNVGNGPLAMDVCTAMICAPVASSRSELMNANSAPTQSGSAVRNAVRLYNADIRKLLEMSAGDAEAIVRLGRRVESQLVVTQIPQLSMPMPIQEQSADQMMVDLGLADGDLNPTGVDTSIDDGVVMAQAGNADFNNADITSALDQPIDLVNPSDAMPSDSNAMPVDPSHSFFDDLNLDISQSMQNPDGSNMDMGATEGQNLEEDIFAGLDMGALDEDFTFN